MSKNSSLRYKPRGSKSKPTSPYFYMKKWGAAAYGAMSMPHVHLALCIKLYIYKYTMQALWGRRVAVRRIWSDGRVPSRAVMSMVMRVFAPEPTTKPSLYGLIFAFLTRCAIQNGAASKSNASNPESGSNVVSQIRV